MYVYSSGAVHSRRVVVCLCVRVHMSVCMWVGVCVCERERDVCIFIRGCALQVCGCVYVCGCGCVYVCACVRDRKRE